MAWRRSRLYPRQVGHPRLPSAGVAAFSQQGGPGGRMDGSEPKTETRTEAGQSVVSLTTLAAITVTVILLYLARDIVIPLALAMLLAFVLSPLVSLLRRAGLPEIVAVSGAALSSGGLVGLVLILMGQELAQLVAEIPAYQANILAKIEGLLASGSDNVVFARLGRLGQSIAERLTTAMPSGGDGASLAAPMAVRVVDETGMPGIAARMALPLLIPIGQFALVFVLVVFMLLERAALRDRLVRLIGASDILATSHLLAEATTRVSTYLVTQLLVNAIYALPIGLGLWAIGLPNAAFFGMVTLVLRFVPFVGSALAALFPLVMAFAVFPDWTMVLATGALFLTVEALTSNIVEPWLYGARTGLSGLAVIVSSMFWTWLWGPVGLIIATPLTVCLLVLGRHVPRLRIFAILLGDAPALAPEVQLYDRLLTGRPVDILAQTGEAPGRATIAAFHDRRLLSALALAETDRAAGLLGEEVVARIETLASALLAEVQEVLDEEPEGETPAPVLRVRRVGVMGLRGGLDDLAALAVGQALAAAGAEVLTLTRTDAVEAESRIGTGGMLVCVALALPLTGTPLARLRRLKRRAPRLRLGLFCPLLPGTLAPHPPEGADFVCHDLGALTARLEPSVPVESPGRTEAAKASMKAS